MTMMTNGAAPSPLLPLQRAHRRRPLQHSFHVLSDGSEYTGNGCIFLTIHPTTTSTIRYALSGVCEQVSRLAADQRFPLYSTRAVFCLDDDCLDGLASLLLTLQQAGAASLTVVGANGTCESVEGIVETVLHKRTTHPKVQTCEMPEEHSQEWFQVYQDEYLFVHAKTLMHHHSSSTMMVYTLLVDDKTRTSFAILPFGCNDVSQLDPLPEYVGKDSLDFVFLLNASLRTSVDAPEKIARRILRTAPNNTAIDDGLLIRAQYHAQQRQSFLYPFDRETRKDVSDESVVTTCSTWSFMGADDSTASGRIDRDSYKSEIWESCSRNSEKDGENQVEGRDDFYGNDTIVDENEIDLNDENDADDEDTIPPTVPHLLVLGTGCASPSPHRGSSGYALVLRGKLKVVVECGEGFVTSLRRHLPNHMDLEEELCNISIIWISHAHLDHYGGLPSLLRSIRNAHHRRFETDSKRQRFNPPIVVAPRKVLKYLAIMLGNQSQLHYEGLTHQEWEAQAPHRLPSMPFQVLHSVSVEHCPNAYALLLAFRNEHDNSNVLLCYSGDCRPSLNLIHAVHRLRNGESNELTLLLHEATFDDQEAEMARRKRHSTVSEALWVANEMKPDATLLTHFSQRYVKTAPGCNNERQSCLNYGVCDDGLRLPLTPKALASVHLLLKS